MPIYQYRCMECKRTMDKFQTVAAANDSCYMTCETCLAPAEKIMSVPSIVKLNTPFH